MRSLAVCLVLGLFAVLASGQTGAGSSYIGLRVREVTAERVQDLKLDAQRGAEVVAVDEDSPAAKAGIQIGDVLLTYNGENILGTQQLGRLVSETPAGRRVSVHLWRSGRLQATWVTTGTKPQPDVTIPDFPIAADIPGSVIVWRNRILGTVCEALPPQLTTFFGVQRGVLVRYVDKGMLGDTAGFKAGDVILASADHVIGNPRDLTAAMLSETGMIHSARFTVLRDHKRLFIDVHPAD